MQNPNALIMCPPKHRTSHSLEPRVYQRLQCCCCCWPITHVLVRETARWKRMSQLQACRGAYIICRASPMILCGVELLRAQHLRDPVLLLTALIIISSFLSSLLASSFGTRILRG
ncbi:hypothetical protein BO82DRAFT_64638 [Aspergillus uvarum CBS 121591]|uniref:Uncharacterized protein n=1 Tax=Aspergillus uvarum CBS 121591 TaxID=1448315 RepID=A0A319C8W2_9EURO|nr:hypothetical protein BO82DRAFT_64638 [Aspergillus uvarum CBS 121591]PYH82246.1 hypothetical protein BO82DRAFT_64638 [Aspergillus uvarum CBS 121591]